MDKVKRKCQKTADISVPYSLIQDEKPSYGQMYPQWFFSLFCNILASKAEMSGKSLKRLLYCVQPTVLLQPAAYYLLSRSATSVTAKACHFFFPLSSC